MTESIPLEDIKTGKVSNRYRHFKIKVLKNLGSEDINEIVQNHLDQKSIVFSDKSTSYMGIAKYVDIQFQKNQPKKQHQKHYPGHTFL